MALSELEQLELEKLEREKERRQVGNTQQVQQSAQQQTQPTQQPNILNKLMSVGLLGPAGMSPVQNAIGSMARGMIEPPAKMIGRAGQALESLISGKPPQNYSIPMPESWGGNIDIQPAQNLWQAGVPAVETALEVGSVPITKGVTRVISKLTQFDNALIQAKKSKTALDGLRNTLGQAKQIALEEIKDVPAELDWSGNVSEKIVKAIQNPVYKVETTEEGGVVQTIGNLDKIKTALQDLVTTKDYVEAGNMEKRQILQFAGKVRDTMVETANKIGRPELGKALKDYHNFMDNYEVINSHLTDKFGNAMANKLKSTFKWGAEPVIKEMWKEVAKASPEVKGIIKSRENRELLKNLLKLTSIGVPVLETGKKLITGRW